MRYRRIADEPETFALIFSTGEIVEELSRVAKAEEFGASSFKAIGALSHVQLGWFDWETKRYETVVELTEQVELLSMIGDIALKGGAPQVHAHAIVGRRDGKAYDGYLLKAIVRPTCELILTESPEHLKKRWINGRESR